MYSVNIRTRHRKQRSLTLGAYGLRFLSACPWALETLPPQADRASSGWHAARAAVPRLPGHGAVHLEWEFACWALLLLHALPSRSTRSQGARSGA